MLPQGNNPRERDPERFLKLLQPELGVGERPKVHHTLPGEDRLMRRNFFADPVEAAWCAASLTSGEVYVDAGPRGGEAR